MHDDIRRMIEKALWTRGSAYERGARLMASSVWLELEHAAPIWGADGPTGEFAEVLEGVVQDYGGNVLYGPASPDACVERSNPRGIAAKLVPTKWRAVDGEVCGADHTWQMVTAPDSTD